MQRLLPNISPTVSSRRRCRSTTITSIRSTCRALARPRLQMDRHSDRRGTVFVLGAILPRLCCLSSEMFASPWVDGLRSAVRVTMLAGLALAVLVLIAYLTYHGGGREAVSSGAGYQSSDRAEGAPSAADVHALRHRQLRCSPAKMPRRRSSSTMSLRNSSPTIDPMISVDPDAGRRASSAFRGLSWPSYSISRTSRAIFSRHTESRAFRRAAS